MIIEKVEELDLVSGDEIEGLSIKVDELIITVNELIDAVMCLHEKATL